MSANVLCHFLTEKKYGQSCNSAKSNQCESELECTQLGKCSCKSGQFYNETLMKCQESKIKFFHDFFFNYIFYFNLFLSIFW